MWIPLAILAVLSLVGGFYQHPEIPGADLPAGRRRRPMSRLMAHLRSPSASAASRSPTVLCAAPAIPDALAQRFSGLYTLIYNKYLRG